MRIAKLEFKDVGPFEHAVFEIPEPKGPGEVVLFEGPNGSGKTTILQAIAIAVSEIGPGDGLSSRAQRMQGFGGAHTMPPLTEWTRRRHSKSSLTTLEFVDASSLLIVSLEHNSIRWGGLSTSTHEVTEVLRQFKEVLGDQGNVGSTPWAAFAYQGHQRSVDLATPGPRDIADRPLDGVLSFGVYKPASVLVGQVLTNLEFERVKATLYVQESGPSPERDGIARIAEARRSAMNRFEIALSKVLDRTVSIKFPFGQHTPEVELDGENIPLDLLGEGMRSTIAWVADLLVRLERIPWADTTQSPIDQNFWLILDEIEESLHPTMQARLFPALRELFPNARIYATTHSPFVVASASEGTIFAIRPDKDHKVRGKIEPRPLEPGQSLEWVVSEIFQARAGFVDQKTRDMLDAHKRDIRRFQRNGGIDWEAFFARRAELMKLNDEVRTVVAMQEVPVRTEVDRRMLERAEALEQ